MSSTHLPHQPGPGTGSPEEKPAPDLTVSMLNADDDKFYLLSDPDDDEAGDPFGMHQATPFQMSQPMPPVQHASPAAPTASAHGAQTGYVLPPSSPPSAAPPSRPRRKLSPFLLAAVATVVVVVVITTVMTAFAQSTPKAPVATTGAATTQPANNKKPKAVPTSVATRPPKGAMTPTAQPNPPMGPAPQANTMPSWTDQQLPDGWQNAKLTKSDAIEANRTALSFTDREMGLDFRDMGTRANHGGTFTSSFFLLTPAAKARFPHNDVRALNNTLFDRVASQQLIEAAVDATPRIAQFQQQDTQQFAWVDVTFHLWKSQVDVNTPQQRVEGLDMDPKTQQPRMHHMVVLLKRVAPEHQGPGAPMGGTGWLVSNYALDQQALPDRVQPA